MSLAREAWDAAAQREAWIAKQLEAAPPLTQQQEANLRRVLLAPRRKASA